MKDNNKMSSNDDYTLLRVISFIFPIIGLIVYAVNVGKNDKLANDCIKFALIPFIVIPILIFILYNAFNFDNNKISNSNVITKIVDIPVKVLYNKEIYVIDGVPSNIKIELKGISSDIYSLINSDNFYVVLDLKNYNASKNVYSVPYIFDNPIEDINYKIIDKNANVNIKEKHITTTNKVTIQYIDKDNSITNTIIDYNVILKGEKTLLDKVDKIVGIVDLTKGNNKDYKIMLNAYDKNNNILENIEIVPKNIDVDTIQ